MKLRSAERYLAIETSSPRLSLAAGVPGEMPAVFEGPLQWRHAENLFEGLEALLGKLGWPVPSLRGVAVSIGPGSFTGIRIGIAAARALGQALGLGVVGVSALEAMAFQARSEGARWVSAEIEASADHVFAALFEVRAGGRLRKVIPERYATREDWVQRLRRQRPLSQILRVCEGPHAAALLELALPRLRRAGRRSFERVVPLYVRRSAPEERRRR